MPPISYRGVLHLAGPKVRVFLREAFEAFKADEFTELQTPADHGDGRRVHVDGFAKAVSEGAPVPVSGAEARRALEIVRGAYLAGKRHDLENGVSGGDRKGGGV